MAYKLQLKRGASGSLPTGSAGEPLFTTDTNDLYIGTGAANQRFQKYIASGTSAQFLKGDGSLDSTTYTPTSRTLTINGTSFDLSANRTWNVGTVTTAAATTGGQVMFSNGATVITSVSGLYFDGVNKLGIGNSSPAYNLDVTGDARMISSSSSQTLYLQNSGTGYGLYNQADSYFQGDVEFQSVTSTLLKVDASHKLIAAVAGTDYQAPITNPVTGTGTTNYLPKWTSGSAIGNSNLINDSSGNLGLGVVPSAWANGIRALEISLGNGLWSSTPTQIILNSNSIYTSGGFTYASSNASAYYSQFAGGHYWFNAPSGTAGAAITFTQAMTLTSGGNLLINSTTDNGSRLQVTGSLDVRAGSIISGNGTIQTALTYATNGIIGTLSNHSLSIYTNNAERVNISTTGAATFNSSVAATNGVFNGVATYNLKVQNGASANTLVEIHSFGTEAAGENATLRFKSATASLNEYAKASIAFRNNGTGYGRGDLYFNVNNDTTSTNVALSDSKLIITSGGNLLVGTSTDSGERLQVNGSAKIASSVAGAFNAISLTNSSNSSSARNIIKFTNDSINVGYLEVFSSTWGATGGGDDVPDGMRLFADGSGGLSVRATNGSIRFYTGSTERLVIKSNGIVNISNVPSSSAGLSSGDIYKDASGFLKIV